MARAVTDPPSSGRIALVTGAGRDREIGTAVCRALAAAGDRVAFTVHPGGPSDGSALAAELGAVAISADLAAADAAEALLDAVEERLGAAPAVLVNNAAYETRAGFAELDGAALDAHYTVNVRAPVLLSCELARRHPRGAPGRIVCLTSGQSFGPMLGELPYAVTKGALETFVEQVAPELMALGVTINAVNPGVTDTGWIGDEIRGEVTRRMPAGRVGQSEDAARLIAWLCSDDAAWVTGQVISSEGGFLRS
jgi:3-oxoacyl-[acyl-carrier protein] reductase